MLRERVISHSNKNLILDLYDLMGKSVGFVSYWKMCWKCVGNVLENVLDRLSVQ